MRYNPPPNWPQPPAGWTPPEGLAARPAWGPAPPGHQLWVPDQPQYGVPAGAAPMEQKLPKKKSRKWLWIILGIIIVIALFAVRRR